MRFAREKRRFGLKGLCDAYPLISARAPSLKEAHCATTPDTGGRGRDVPMEAQCRISHRRSEVLQLVLQAGPGAFPKFRVAMPASLALRSTGPVQAGRSSRGLS